MEVRDSEVDIQTTLQHIRFDALLCRVLHFDGGHQLTQSDYVDFGIVHFLVWCRFLLWETPRPS